MIDFVSRPYTSSTIVVEVNGSLAEGERQYFFDCIGDLVQSGYENIIIECHKIGFVSSSGLASILAARKRAAKKGGRIYLTHLNSNLAEVLEITKLGRLLRVYPSTEAVISHIENQLECVG
jgi:anti-sigma B factor antagonist